MSFNTAIFYDIENLLKGYSFSYQMLANLSLKEVVGSIRQTNRLGQVAVQRAYANWSDSRLANMRFEINELGIDPIQVFGFSRDQKHNAADIQLAIDAIDLAHVRPAVEVFVIVSGDGGFASLAKKLHEYGKTVIGCAYKKATNRVFQAVCDDFVWINDPDEEEKPEKPAPQPQTNGGNGGPSDPRNARMLQRVKKCSSQTPEDVLAKVREVLNWYASDPTTKGDLERSGVYLPMVQEGVKHAVPGFKSAQYGFAKFIEYMQFACTQTNLCLVRPPNAQAVISFREPRREGVEYLPDLHLRDLHTSESYRSILGAGVPVLRLPPPGDLRQLAEWVTQTRPRQAEFAALVEAAVTGTNNALAFDAAKLGLLSMVAAGQFEREPEGVSLYEQKLSLLGDLTTAEAVLATLKAEASNKLIAAVGQCQEEALAELFSGPTALPAEEAPVPDVNVPSE
jgi:uncharacterized LabA/DUF88 family protein